MSEWHSTFAPLYDEHVQGIASRLCKELQQWPSDPEVHRALALIAGMAAEKRYTWPAGAEGGGDPVPGLPSIRMYGACSGTREYSGASHRTQQGEAADRQGEDEEEEQEDERYIDMLCDIRSLGGMSADGLQTLLSRLGAPARSAMQ